MVTLDLGHDDFDKGHVWSWTKAYHQHQRLARSRCASDPQGARVTGVTMKMITEQEELPPI